MIRFNVEQGSQEWAMLRLGIPTASQFARVLTPKTMKTSGQMADYAHELLAEQVLKIPLDHASTGLMQRGTLMERKAVDWYELQKEIDTEQVGFILRDDRRVGCSPDRFVGADGMLQIKVPAADTHVAYLLDDEGIGYRCQVQGELWLAERDWIDTLSWHPEMPCALVRQQRDEKFIAALAAAVKQLLDYMDECKLKLQKKGLFAGERVPDLRVVA
jgi:hypothetical protein